METCRPTSLIFIYICFVLETNQYTVMKSSNAGIDPFVITTNKPSPFRDFSATIANGYVGHQVHNDTIYKTGFYNGKYGNSHRARISSTLPYVDVDAMKIETYPGHTCNVSVEVEYTLHMRKGSFLEKFNLFCKDNSTRIGSVTQTLYAHSKLKIAIVTEVKLELVSRDTNMVLRVPLKDSRGNTSHDTTLIEHDITIIPPPCLHEYLMNATYEQYATNTAETNTSNKSNIHILSTVIPSALVLNGENEKTFAFISSLGESKKLAFDAYEKAATMFEENSLYTSHTETWQTLWARGNIVIASTNKDLAHSAVTGLYYLLSALPPDGYVNSDYDFYGVSPGGLTNGGENQDYWGHVFWDQDFWMLPALLPLFPEKVKLALIYRVKKLGAAKNKAHEFGYDGAFYPWESAHTGVDVCPGARYIKYEQHNTADLIHIIKQYLYATDDWVFMDEVYNGNTAWDVVYETAKFWISRVYKLENNQFGIKDVMGPDEYHSRVNNSAFTNAAAAINLKFAAEAANKLGKTISEYDQFVLTGDNMYIPYDEEYKYHPEFDGFDWKKDVVKQADTIMLNYPLNYLKTATQMLADLDIYENITDPRGPAMTSGMFAINWLSVSETNKADKSFVKQFANIQPPFQIWTELSDGTGAFNFLTGIGGFLQSILYGYAGIRIDANDMTIRPYLLPDDGEGAGYSCTGLKFKGNEFNLAVGDTCLIVVTKLDPHCTQIRCTLPDESVRFITQGETLEFGIQEKIILEPIFK